MKKSPCRGGQNFTPQAEAIFQKTGEADRQTGLLQPGPGGNAPLSLLPQTAPLAGEPSKAAAAQKPPLQGEVDAPPGADGRVRRPARQVFFRDGTQRGKKMGYPRNEKLLENARALRKTMTPQERHLWYDYLRTCPFRFVRQKIMGPYILDFYCHSARLAIEIDGSQHYEKEGRAADAKRAEFLNSIHIDVLRFSNAEVNTQFAAVCSKILTEAQKRKAVIP